MPDESMTTTLKLADLREMSDEDVRRIEDEQDAREKPDKYDGGEAVDTNWR